MRTGKLFVCLRNEMRLSREQMARILGTKTSTLARIETGCTQPSLPVFLKACTEGLNENATTQEMFENFLYGSGQ